MSATFVPVKQGQPHFDMQPTLITRPLRSAADIAKGPAVGESLEFFLKDAQARLLALIAIEEEEPLRQACRRLVELMTDARLVDRVRTFTEAVIACSEHCGKRKLVRFCYHVNAVLAKMDGNLPEALAHINKAIALAVELNDKASEVRSLSQLASILSEMGNVQTSFATAKTALEIGDTHNLTETDSRSQALGAVSHACVVLAHQGFSRALMLGEGVAAIEKAVQYLPVGEGAFATLNRIRIYYTKVQLLVLRGDIAAAKQLSSEVCALADDHPYDEAHVLALFCKILADAPSMTVEEMSTQLFAHVQRKVLSQALRCDLALALATVFEATGAALAPEAYSLGLLDARHQAIDRNRSHWQLIQDTRSTAKSFSAIAGSEGVVAELMLLNRRQLFEARTDALARAAAAAELRQEPLGKRLSRIGRLSRLLAREAGFSQEMVALIEPAAKLHDIGKLGVPDSLLRKATPLSIEERLALQSHTVLGATFLATNAIPDMDMAIDIAKYHHERWDGRGFPDGLQGEQIPMAARIVSLVDVFDALTHDRAYRPAGNFDAAASEILAGRGTSFDPSLTAIFLRLLVRLMNEHTSLPQLDAFLTDEGRV
jgi:putative two-component system response regulator